MKGPDGLDHSRELSRKSFPCRDQGQARVHAPPRTLIKVMPLVSCMSAMGALCFLDCTSGKPFADGFKHGSGWGGAEQCRSWTGLLGTTGQMKLPGQELACFSQGTAHHWFLFFFRSNEPAKLISVWTYTWVFEKEGK